MKYKIFFKNENKLMVANFDTSFIYFLRSLFKFFWGKFWANKLLITIKDKEFEVIDIGLGKGKVGDKI